VEDFVVGAIERMVRDLGFDVPVETSRLFIEFWPGENE
jgi:hypothetical protein